jgi:adenine-specific DNA-methyltransferase
MPRDNKEKELLDHISDLELQIKKLKDRKRYGLVWEDKKEKFEEESKNALPILQEKGGKFQDIITDKNKDFNILIEGDNYHSLSVLSYTHKNMVDVIYIDPPYNTGNKDFIYNDHFVDKEDRFRHSKWLSFLNKRLKLAKSLLKKEGIIFISIDDNEQAQLKMLCDEIFGQENFIANLARRTKSAGKTTDTISLNNDYVLVYAKNRKVVKFKAIPIDDKAYKYKDEYYSERGSYALSQTLDYDSLSYSDSLDYELKIGNRKYYPGGDKRAFFKRKSGHHRSSDWTWRWSKELVDFGNKNGFVVIKNGKNGQFRIYTKTYFKVVIEKLNGKYAIVPVDRAKNLSTLDLMESIYSNDVAKKDIRSIFGASAEFSYSKPVELINYLINSTYKHNNLTVLDFMAGSGTTGQAVLELNKKDGGNRRFILCTNNENKICENITYERIKRVSTGYKNSENKKVEGLGGNLKYLKTDFVKLEKSVDSLKHKIVDGSTEILCLKEGTFDIVANSYKKNRAKIFQSQSRYTAILFDLFYFEEFIEQLKKLKDKPVSVYVFSYTKDFSKEEFGDLGIKFTIEPIPEKILETYKKIFNF